MHKLYAMATSTCLAVSLNMHHCAYQRPTGRASSGRIFNNEVFVELVYISDPEQIEKCRDFVLDMCHKSYQPIGGFKSLANASDFTKRVNRIKMVLEAADSGDNAVGACGLYRYINDGWKAIGYASNKDVPSYIDCIKLIIRDDIAKYKDWYWVEASHAIAHLYEKMGGYSIPNIYVPEFTAYAVKESDLMPDGFGYTRKIGLGDAAVRVIKYLYGFPNRDMYMKIMDIYGDMGNFVAEVNKIKQLDKTVLESVNNIPGSLPSQVRTLIMFVYNLDDCIIDNDVYEFPPSWFETFHNVMRMLNQYAMKHPCKAVEEAIKLGNDISTRITPLELHQFKGVPPVPHTEL